LSKTEAGKGFPAMFCDGSREVFRLVQVQPWQSRNQNSEKSKALSDESGEMWISSEGLPYRLLPSSEGYVVDSIPFQSLELGVRAIFPDRDGVVWLGGDNGLAAFHPKVQKNYRQPYHCLIRQAVLPGAAVNGADSILYSGISYAILQKAVGNAELRGSEECAIPHNVSCLTTQPQSLIPTLTHQYNNIRFEFSAPVYERQDAVEYSHVLVKTKDKSKKTKGKNELPWSNWSKDTKKEYNNLDPGKYTYFVKAKNVYGHESEVGGV